MEYTLYSVPGFKVYAQVEDGRVAVRTSGLLAPLFSPLVSGYAQLLSGTPVRMTDTHLYVSTWLPPIPGAAFDRLVKNQVRSFFRDCRPDQVTISITEECPNRCIHCALPDTKHRKRLPPQEIKSVIDQSVELGASLVIFDGGEPMLYEGIEELVAYASGRAAATLFTSGYGLSREKAAGLRDAGLHAVNVSFDSPLEEEHDRIRGRQGVFREAVDAVKNAVAEGLLVDIYVVAAPFNIDRLDDFYSLASDLHANELSFYEIVPTGRWSGHESEVLDCEQREKLCDFRGMDKDKDTGVRVFPIPAAMAVTGCFAGKKWLHVTPGGDVLPCACIPVPYGSIYTEPLRKIWERIRNSGLYNARSCLMRDERFRQRMLPASDDRQKD